jgi:hypothetical protein
MNGNICNKSVRGILQDDNSLRSKETMDLQGVDTMALNSSLFSLESKFCSHDFCSVFVM